LSELPRAVVGYDRLALVFAEPITVEPATRPISLPDGPLGVDVDHITYTYADAVVLDDVTLRIETDESVAIVRVRACVLFSSIVPECAASALTD
jgi:ABC-type bacteriocin/lantibiotic exporter with double-glycine peptidase domain